MESFELNKVLGAVLGTCLFLDIVHLFVGTIFAPEKPTKPGYEIAVNEPPTGEPEATKKAPEEPIEKLLAKADVSRGEQAANKCKACHTFEKGGPTRIGPNLWGIVDRKRASEAGFNYSAAIKTKGGKWTFEELNKFLTNPRTDIPGTAMTFAGISRPQERANVIDYLRTLSENPIPLPKVAESPSSASPPNTH